MDGEGNITGSHWIDASRMTEEVLVLNGATEEQGEVEDEVSDVANDTEDHKVNIQSNHTSSVAVQQRLEERVCSVAIYNHT